MYWSGENKAPDTINPTLLKDTVLEMVESSFGQESLSNTDLHVFHDGNLTGVIYRDKILDAYVRLYAAAIGNDFILMMPDLTELCLLKIILRVKF